MARGVWSVACRMSAVAMILVLVAAALPVTADTILPPTTLLSRTVRTPRENYSADNFLVRLSPGADRDAFAARVQREIGSRPSFHDRFDGYASVHVPQAADDRRLPDQAISRLSALPSVESVRPHMVMHAHATPNDPFFKDYGDPSMDPDLMDNQYYLFDVYAPEAWDVERGSADTVIAVIDSGVSVHHEDLADKIVSGYDFVGDNAGWWTDTDKDDPLSKDDNPTVWDPAWGQPDEHGYPGFDIFSEDEERAEWWADNYDTAIGDTVSNDSAIDPYGSMDNGVAHGTIVASMAGATTDNGLGMAGIAWNPSIMPVRVINPEGWGFGIDAADAIYWAVENGAHVLNFSWGFGPMYTIDPDEFEPGGEGYLIQQAIEWAHEQGVFIVASAGNADGGSIDDYGNHEYFGDGLDHAGGLDFPANLPETISVGSTNEERVKSDFSSYADPLLGEILDVTAPGESIHTMGMWSGSVLSAYDWWLWGELTSGEPTLPLGEDLYDAGAMGTSFSAPIVSGLSALIKSRYPHLTNDDLREILTVSAEDLSGEGYHPYYGYGLANAFAGVTYSDAYVPEPVTASLFLAGIAVIGWRARRRGAA